MEICYYMVLSGLRFTEIIRIFAGMKVRDIIGAIERTAQLKLQDEWDNSGLQVGFLENEVSRVLVCLDVTEAILDEAAERGCRMIVSHHPLLFRPLSQVSDSTYQQRCVVKALAGGIAVYSAHTSLDNAPGGVNHKIAALLGLTDLEWLQPKDGMDAGSGIIGTLPQAVPDTEFLKRVKQLFKVECLRHTATCGKTVKRVALCGGAGAFLMRDAIRKGADCFITGEFHYHDYFENDGMLLAELGHYQSESCTIDLLADILGTGCPGLEVVKTSLNTNPTCYDA